jgi:putative sigma-54 modulation protein
MKVRTESVHFTADQKLLDVIDKKMDRLTRYFDRIVDASVILKLENSGQVRDKIVEIKLNVPGETLFVEDSNKTFESALDTAMAGLKRQLIRYKERNQNHR